jgi:hypothetical protein
MMRGYAAEFGLTAARGLDKIEPLLARIATDPSVLDRKFAALRLGFELSVVHAEAFD